MFTYSKVNNYAKPYVIAEIGANHNGSVDLAKKLIDIAKQNGADCVKFQSWTKDSVFSKKVYEENCFLNDDYRNRTDYTLESIVDAYSLSKEEHIMLNTYCQSKGIDFASTPFSNDEVDFLVDTLNVPFIKIASMDLNNIPFLKYIATKNKPVMLSVGLGGLSDIIDAVQCLEENGCNEIIILHCVSIYPPKDDQVNLNNIDMLRDLFHYPIGYSDHTIGTTASILSIAKGSCVIEKHFTLDKSMEGWDHKVSADPPELRAIVVSCGQAYKMLGSYNKVVNESPEQRNAFKRSIVAANNISKGQIIRLEDLSYKRPGTGIEPKYYNFLIGKAAKNDISKDTIIEMEDF